MAGTAFAIAYKSFACDSDKPSHYKMWYELVQRTGEHQSVNIQLYLKWSNARFMVRFVESPTRLKVMPKDFVCKSCIHFHGSLQYAFKVLFPQVVKINVNTLTSQHWQCKLRDLNSSPFHRTQEPMWQQTLPMENVSHLPWGKRNGSKWRKLQETPWARSHQWQLPCTRTALCSTQNTQFIFCISQIPSFQTDSETINTS